MISMKIITDFRLLFEKAVEKYCKSRENVKFCDLCLNQIRKVILLTNVRKERGTTEFKKNVGQNP